MAKQVKQSIGNVWSIMIDEGFGRAVHDGDVVLSMSGRTVYCSVFRTQNSDAEDAIEKMIEGRPGIPVQIFDRHEAGLVGHGYLLPEYGSGKNYWGLNTWTAARGSVCCVTLYFDDFNDFNWAISAWKSVRPEREVTTTLN